MSSSFVNKNSVEKVCVCLTTNNVIEDNQIVRKLLSFKELLEN